MCSNCPYSNNNTEENNITSEYVNIIGVKFKEAGKVYYFDPCEFTITTEDFVIVDTARGIEFGIVAFGNKTVPAAEIVPPLRPVVRIATQDDIDRHENNDELEKEAFRICKEKIEEHGLEMKLIEAEYTFDNSKLLFYFSSDSRVDFRELVKDLAGIFRTRIELRQIGTRDEAKMIGGLGICGRPFCCNSFLSDFQQISIKMAKEQNLSLNSSKISGCCGKLMCCLRFEYDTYEEELKLLPPIESTVKTPDGIGTVVEVTALTGSIKVKFTDARNGDSWKVYNKRDVVKL